MTDRIQPIIVDERTWWVKIYISGPIQEIEQVCRCMASEVGLCVTVDPTKFIYSGGEEAGAVVGLIQYPKYPTDEIVITDRAMILADALLVATHQDSVLVMTPTTTTWISKREGNHSRANLSAHPDPPNGPLRQGQHSRPYLP